MGSRNKRPAESRSRGNSPPGKRNCPPGRRSSFQDKVRQHLLKTRKLVTASLTPQQYAATRNPWSCPSPPASRRSSAAIPTGQPSDQHRPNTQQSEDGSQDPLTPAHNAPIMSPQSIGSGASTPAHQVAPIVPSMLSHGGDSVPASYVARMQPQEAPTGIQSKPTMDALRKMRARRIALASTLNANSMTFHTPAPAPALAPVASSVSIQLENLVKELLNEVAQLKKERLAMAKRLDALEQLKSPTTPETNGPLETTVKAPEHLKAVLVRQDKLENELQSLLDSQSTEAGIKRIVAEEVSAKLEGTKQVIETANKVSRTVLEKRIDHKTKSLSDKHSELIRHINKHIGPTKEEYEKTNKPIVDRVREVEVDIRSLQKGFEEADRRTQDRLHRFSTQIGQVKNVQSEQSKLATRVDNLEKTILKPGTLVQSLPSSFPPTEAETTATTDDLVNFTSLRLSHVEKLVNELRLDKQANSETHVESNEKIAADMAQLREHVELEFTRLRTEVQLRLSDGANQSFQDRLESWDEVIENLERDASDKGLRISVLEDSVPKQFYDKFDPLQQKVDRIVAQIEENQIGHTEMGKERQNLERLEQSILDEKVTREKAVCDLSSRLATKAESDVRQMDAFRLTLQNLYDQYKNITSDDVHQKMVHWFLQMHPSNSASMLQQFAVLKRDVSHLQSRSNELQNLLNKQYPSKIIPEQSDRNENPRSLANAVDTTAEETLTRVDALKKQTDALQSGLQDLQLRLHYVNGAVATSASKSALDSLSHSIQMIEQQLQSSKADTQSIQHLEKGLAKVKEIIDDNAVFLPQLGVMYVAIAELQDHLQSVNINTSAKKPLELDWTYNLKNDMLESHQ
ncbi:hypothetical protein IAQ61_008090 [Plenodomus lingam]|uniref:uncharacterized protein n=1 Tax=Leptosphaeria maculans TaxID=5022 RepID=UPI0033310A01|nr:hypothetical protein IAQ61_008090 [Plenodomus lingam]